MRRSFDLRAFKRLLLCVVLTNWSMPSSAVTAAKEVDSSVTFRSGFVSYNKKGVLNEQQTNTTNGSLELTRYFKRDLATSIGYRLSQDPATGRTSYQAGFVTLRIFPFTLGAPVESLRGPSLVEYDFRFKPYIDGGLSIGRSLIALRGEQGVLEVSSEFYGINLGAGSLIRLTKVLALDLGALYEICQGFGPISYQADNMYAQVGLLYYF